MQIRFILDEQHGIDPVDPSGSIEITDGHNLISEKYVYLDSWLDALITGLKTVEDGKSVTVDLVEEPDQLTFEPHNGGLKMQYRESRLMFKSVRDFEAILRTALNDFLNQARPANSPIVHSIRKFVAQSSMD